MFVCAEGGDASSSSKKKGNAKAHPLPDPVDKLMNSFMSLSVASLERELLSFIKSSPLLHEVCAVPFFGVFDILEHFLTRFFCA